MGVAAAQETLISEAEYESLIETLALLSVPGFKDAFDRTRGEADSRYTRSFDEVFDESR